MSQSFWQRKKVLVTGHTGFKGSWLSLWLQSMGADVAGLSLAPHTSPSLFEISKVEQGMRSYIGDIRDAAFVRGVVEKEKPEIVFHLAAQALVRFSYGNPVDTYATNVMGTVHVLDAIRTVGGVRVVVNITSDKCYENQEWVWGYRENEPMGGYDPYSNSKGCAELVASAYRSSFFNPADFARHGVALASVRAGNVIGGGDWAEDRLIPDCLRAIEAKQPVAIRNPHAIRPWQHVLEPLSGYLLLAEKMWGDGITFSEGWNFGPNDDDAKPVRWIIDQMTSQWGRGAAWVQDAGEHAHEAHYLKLDCSKAKMQLGWIPRWNIITTLQEIVAWHRAYLSGENMREVTLQQIVKYQGKPDQKLQLGPH
jgi:CDP-glucose 4,6-dehydratase